MEDESNIIMMCRDCAERAYPRKGKFTAEELRVATHAKAKFSDDERNEHMWIAITKVTETEVFGQLANEPVIIQNLMLWDDVAVPISEVEDIIT